MSKSEPSDLILEIGAKLFPRRYRRFRDMRTYQEACQWARTLDWRQNPYDRYLLRRELLHHLECSASYQGRRNIFMLASRGEIAAEVDRMMDRFPDKLGCIGVFTYVLVGVPLNLRYKHGKTRHSRLLQALATLPSTSRDG